MVELYAAFTVLSMDNGTRDAVIITLAGILSHLVWYVVKHSWKACFGNSETQNPNSDVRNSKTDNGERESEATASKLKHSEPSKAVPNTSPREKLHSALREFINGRPELERSELRIVGQENKRQLEELLKERDDALKQRDQYSKNCDDACKDRDDARKQRDEDYRDRDSALQQLDGAHKIQDDLRESKLEAAENYKAMSDNLWDKTERKIYQSKQRYDERLRKAMDQTAAIKAASLEGKCANCSGIRIGDRSITTGGSYLTAALYKVMNTAEIGQDEEVYENLQQLRDKARQEIGVVVDRSYGLYSLMLTLDGNVERNNTLGVKGFQGLTEFTDYIGAALDHLVER
ncbi:hypothetical protein VE01_03727 [Pseudogymnoascus verrucosus]|uniref:Uncharacterized protein n=1 Tax=Pseudogymnoascus verrucosus TaxID=342668 RepID=A0A1B8GQF2_9PEZI|nr:uncharacterized protein VE01_03727 [Pseudogymnoascus verrucosus]OBT98066.1 hypothetical protein VE01_03727 [Pseudogymnoascus verrucosus]